jgi:hypothetical protein
MKIAKIKKLPVLIISAAVLMVSTGAAQAADTVTQPYLKSYGGDVMTGAWFSNGTNCSTGSTSNYQDPNFANGGFAADTRAGGILTYSKTAGTSSGGDSSQYAAFSIGEVDGRRAGDGFYSAGTQAAANPPNTVSVKALTIANSSPIPGLAFGGKAEGSVSQSNCIVDYYSKKPASTAGVGNLNSVIARGSGDYADTAAAGSSFDLTGGSVGQTYTIPAGKRITIYINGNVYISGNIVYDSAATVDNTPKFALIVKGSIYIDPGVTRLDGMYVAQPAGTTAAAVAADDGIIWTCHPTHPASAPGTVDPTDLASCTLPLAVNGALIAKQVNFVRVGGGGGAGTSDVSTTASTAEDSLGTVGTCNGTPNANCHLSEVVNYSPAMIMGGSFFGSSTTSTTGGLPIDSVISLPPVF